MKNLLSYLLIASAIVVIGCEGIVSPEVETRAEDSMSPNQALDGNNVTSSDDCAIIADYKVCLTDTDKDATSTTFTYTVSPKKPRYALSHLIIGFATCEPALSVLHTSPNSTVVEKDPTTGVGGVKFDLSQGKTETRQYEITFAGSLTEAFVTAAIKAGQTVGTGTVPGAGCSDGSGGGDPGGGDPGGGGEGGPFTVSGTVYVESDEPNTALYTTKQENELGIGNVLVQLLNGQNQVLDSDVADAEGNYSFSNVATGPYKVVVPEVSSNFNPILYLTNSSGPLYVFAQNPSATPYELPVTVDSNEEDVDFGFELQVDAIVEALNGPLATRSTITFEEWAVLLAGLISYEDVLGGMVDPFVKTVNGYNFYFLGQQYDASKNQTTFFYKIEGTGTGKELSHLSLEFGDSVDLVSYSPQNSVSIGTDPTSGITGIKFDFKVSTTGEQYYSLTFAGDVSSSVIDVALKNGNSIGSIKMPGGGGDIPVANTQLLAALDWIFYGGTGDVNYLFLTNPLLLLAGETNEEAAVRIITQEVPFPDSLEDLEQLLLVAELKYVLDQGTPNPEFDATIFKYCEAIIQILSGGESSSASKNGNYMTPMGGTGSSGDAGRMLRAY